MERLVSRLKQLNLQKVLIVFIAGVALLLSTACSNENMRASRQNRPNDIPVQAGANNNPYTMGTDSQGQPAMNNPHSGRAYSNQRSDASSLNLNRLIASSVADNNSTDILYQSRDQRDRSIDTSRPTQEQAYQSESTPVRRQPIINRTDPNEHILENIGEQFEEASKFLGGDVRSSVNHAKSKTIPNREAETR